MNDSDRFIKRGMMCSVVCMLLGLIGMLVAADAKATVPQQAPTCEVHQFAAVQDTTYYEVKCVGSVSNKDILARVSPPSSKR